MTSTPKQDKDWVSQLLDQLDQVIDLIRSQTTSKLRQVARTVVLGLMVLGAGATLVLLAIFAFIRLTVQASSSAGVGAWAAYLALGGLCWLAAAILWRKRRA